MERNILKVLDVSTRHISESDNYRLENNLVDGLLVDNLSGGFLIHINADTQVAFDKLVEYSSINRMSYGFIKLLDLAIKEKFDFIKLDCDGSVYSDLPTFEW